MKELREKLKANANDELNRMIEAGIEAMVKVTGTSAVGRYELARLVIGGRTDSLRKAVIGNMIRATEIELLKRYMDQQDLPLDTAECERLSEIAAGKGKKK